MTQVSIPDTVSLLEPFFTSREHPKELFAKVSDILLAEEGFLRRVQGDAAKTYGLDVLQAAYPEPVAGSQAYGLFNPIRSREASDWIFAQFKAENVLDRLSEALQAIIDAIDYPLDELECLLFPVNTAQALQMKLYHGLYVQSGAAGMLQVLLWPYDANLARLDAVLTHAVAINARAARFGLHTLADWAVAEGLAAHVVAERHPQIELPWCVDFHTPPGWQEQAARLAELHNAPHFDAIPTNIYGSPGHFADLIVPEIEPMDDEEQIYTEMMFEDALQAEPAITNPATIALHLWGDEFVARQGHPTLGLIDYAGFEAAYHLMRRYLQNSGQTATHALSIPTDEILKAVYPA